MRPAWFGSACMGMLAPGFMIFALSVKGAILPPIVRVKGQRRGQVLEPFIAKLATSRCPNPFVTLRWWSSLPGCIFPITIERCILVAAGFSRRQVES
jgi:hypothetical protein